MELQYFHFCLAGLGELAAQCDPCAGKDFVQAVSLAGLSASCLSPVLQLQPFPVALGDRHFHNQNKQGHLVWVFYQAHGLLRKNTCFLGWDRAHWYMLGILHSSMLAMWNECWLVRSIYVAKWKKQHTSNYENLLVFFFPDVAVCLHVLLRSLLNLFLDFCTWTPECEDAVLLSQAVGELRDICRNSSERWRASTAHPVFSEIKEYTTSQHLVNEISFIYIGSFCSAAVWNFLVISWTRLWIQ